MSADMKQVDVLELDNLTADEASREIRECMNRLARLQAVLVEWAKNSEELLETVTVESVQYSRPLDWQRCTNAQASTTSRRTP